MELQSQSRQLQKSGVKAADGPNGVHSILLFACVSFIHFFYFISCFQTATTWSQQREKLLIKVTSKMQP